MAWAAAQGQGQQALQVPAQALRGAVAAAVALALKVQAPRLYPLAQLELLVVAVVVVQVGL